MYEVCHVQNLIRNLEKKAAVFSLERDAEEKGEGSFSLGMDMYREGTVSIYQEINADIGTARQEA